MDVGIFEKFMTMIQSGGQAALLASVYFIYKAAERLARVEMMLEMVLISRGIQPPPKKGDLPFSGPVTGG